MYNRRVGRGVTGCLGASCPTAVSTGGRGGANKASSSSTTSNRRHFGAVDTPPAEADSGHGTLLPTSCLVNHSIQNPSLLPPYFHSTSSPNFLSTLELRVWCRWSSVFVSRTHYVTALYRLPTAKLSYSRRFPSKPTRSFYRHTSSPGASPIGQRLAVNHRYS